MKTLYKWVSGIGLVAVPAAIATGVAVGLKEADFDTSSPEVKTWGDKLFDNKIAEYPQNEFTRRILLPIQKDGHFLSELPVLNNLFTFDKIKDAVKSPTPLGEFSIDFSSVEEFKKATATSKADVFGVDEINDKALEVNKKIFDLINGSAKGKNVGVLFSNNAKDRTITSYIYELKSFDGNDEFDKAKRNLIDNFKNDLKRVSTEDILAGFTRNKLKVDGSHTPGNIDDDYPQLFGGQNIFRPGQFNFWYGIDGLDKNGNSAYPHINPTTGIHEIRTQSPKKPDGSADSGYITFRDYYNVLGKNPGIMTKASGDVLNESDINNAKPFMFNKNPAHTKEGDLSPIEFLRKGLVVTTRPSLDLVHNKMNFVFTVYEVWKAGQSKPTATVENSTLGNFVTNAYRVETFSKTFDLSVMNSNKTDAAKKKKADGSSSYTNYYEGATNKLVDAKGNERKVQFTTTDAITHENAIKTIKALFYKELVDYVEIPIVGPGLSMLGTAVPEMATNLSGFLKVGNMMKTIQQNPANFDLAHNDFGNLGKLKAIKAFEDSGVFDRILASVENDPSIDVNQVIRFLNTFTKENWSDLTPLMDLGRTAKDYGHGLETTSRQYQLFQLAKFSQHAVPELNKVIRKSFPEIYKNTNTTTTLDLLIDWLHENHLVPIEVGVDEIVNNYQKYIGNIVESIGINKTKMDPELIKKLVELIPVDSIQSEKGELTRLLDYLLNHDGAFNSIVNLFNGGQKSSIKRFLDIVVFKTVNGFNITEYIEGLMGAAYTRGALVSSIQVLAEAFKYAEGSFGKVGDGLNSIISTGIASITRDRRNGQLKAVVNFVFNVVGSFVPSLPKLTDKEVESLADSYKDFIDNGGHITKVHLKTILDNIALVATPKGGTAPFDPIKMTNMVDDLLFKGIEHLTDEDVKYLGHLVTPAIASSTNKDAAWIKANEVKIGEMFVTAYKQGISSLAKPQADLISNLLTPTLIKPLGALMGWDAATVTAKTPSVEGITSALISDGLHVLNAAQTIEVSSMIANVVNKFVPSIKTLETTAGITSSKLDGIINTFMTSGIASLSKDQVDYVAALLTPTLQLKLNSAITKDVASKLIWGVLNGFASKSELEGVLSKVIPASVWNTNIPTLGKVGEVIGKLYDSDSLASGWLDITGHIANGLIDQPLRNAIHILFNSGLKNMNASTLAGLFSGIKGTLDGSVLGLAKGIIPALDSPIIETLKDFSAKVTPNDAQNILNLIQKPFKDLTLDNFIAVGNTLKDIDLAGLINDPMVTSIIGSNSKTNPQSGVITPLLGTIKTLITQPISTLSPVTLKPLEDLLDNSDKLMPLIKPIMEGVLKTPIGENTAKAMATPFIKKAKSVLNALLSIMQHPLNEVSLAELNEIESGLSMLSLIPGFPQLQIDGLDSTIYNIMNNGLHLSTQNVESIYNLVKNVEPIKHFATTFNEGNPEKLTGADKPPVNNNGLLSLLNDLFVGHKYVGHLDLYARDFVDAVVIPDEQLNTNNIVVAGRDYRTIKNEIMNLISEINLGKISQAKAFENTNTIRKDILEINKLNYEVKTLNAKVESVVKEYNALVVPSATTHTEPNVKQSGGFVWDTEINDFKNAGSIINGSATIKEKVDALAKAKQSIENMKKFNDGYAAALVQYNAIKDIIPNAKKAAPIVAATPLNNGVTYPTDHESYADILARYNKAMNSTSLDKAELQKAATVMMEANKAMIEYNKNVAILNSGGSLGFVNLQDVTQYLDTLLSDPNVSKSGSVYTIKSEAVFRDLVSKGLKVYGSKYDMRVTLGTIPSGKSALTADFVVANTIGDTFYKKLMLKYEPNIATGSNRHPERIKMGTFIL